MIRYRIRGLEGDAVLVLRGIHHFMVDTALAWYAADALAEMVALRRLVVNLGDHTVAFVAEHIHHCRQAQKNEVLV